MSRSIVGSTTWRGISFLVVAEAFSSACGFLATIHLARTLGAEGFGKLEFATTLVAWWLVLVRGGFDTVLIREAAIRPSRMNLLATILLSGRLFAALITLAAVAAIGAGAGNLKITAIAAGLLLASSLIPDLAARARGQAGLLAVAQVSRGGCLLIWTYVAVRSRENLGWAAAGLVAAEICVISVYLMAGGIALRPVAPARLFRLTKWWGWRSISAVTSRFSRVTLYSIDLVILAVLRAEELGPYAASRRLTFAMLALALVIPSSLSGPLAQTWSRGAIEARALIENVTGRILVLTLPPTVGLLFTAVDWVPILYGRSFDGAGIWIHVLILRLPVLALSALFQSAIIATGRDRVSARLVGWLLVMAFPTYLLGWFVGGGWGVAWAGLLLELVGLVWGFLILEGIGLAPRLMRFPLPLLGGLLAMFATCSLLPSVAVGLRSLAGACGFGLGWLAGRHFRSMQDRKRIGNTAIRVDSRVRNSSGKSDGLISPGRGVREFLAHQATEKDHA